MIDENQPNFTELPSESVDDYGEETVIRRKAPTPPPAPDLDDFEGIGSSSDNAQRIVIPTAEDEKQQVRPKTTPSPRDQPLPRQSNTAIVVLLTIIGTVVVMSGAVGIFWILSNQGTVEPNTNFNVNANLFDANINANLDQSNTLFDANANINANTNVNMNANVNANTKTPTPSPTATPTPTPAEDDSNVNGNANSSTPTPRPSATPKPSVSPSATPSVSPSATPVNMGILNERALSLRTPSYPQVAREMRASGKVEVQVLVDENGNVRTARAVSGHPLLRSSAESAARSSKFNPIRQNGRIVRATGLVVYDFVKQN